MKKFTGHICSLVYSCMIFSSAHLSADIDHVTIKWTTGLCTSSCVTTLKDQFSKVPGVAKIEITQGQGQMSLQWKPNVPFNFIPINGAMSLVGLSIQDLRIKARGNISHDNQRVFLTSTGDNTRFQLLGPVQPSEHHYVIEFSPFTHPLSADMRKDLLDAEAAHQIVTIEGPILEPERSPPLYLIVERITQDKPNK